MPEIHHEGARVYYERSGSGPAVVLGHGLLCDTEMWRGVAPRLAEERTVINIEVRGHRRSTAPKPFTLEDLARDWLAILDAEGIDRATFVGLSMGGMTAMRLALAAPERVDGLVLIDSNGEPEELIKRARYTVLAKLYRRFGYHDLLAARIADIMFGRTTFAERPHLLDFLRTTGRRHDRKHVVHAINAVFTRGPLIDQLHRIAAPTLVLVGEEDRATPVDKSRRIARAIFGARLEVLPRAGHLSALEDPDTVADRVLSFLARHA